MRNTVAKRLRKIAQVAEFPGVQYQNIEHRPRKRLSLRLNEQGERIEEVYQPLPTRKCDITTERGYYKALKSAYNAR